MYALGDLHRNIHHMKLDIDRKEISNTSIFQVGDFEIGFNKPKKEMERVFNINQYLKERNIIMYVIRGNHDNPDYFKGEHLFSNLQFLPDYSIIELDNYKVLCVGGAISPDRKARKMESDMLVKVGLPPCWWEDEGFILKEDLIKKLSGINCVITHTAPSYCKPNGKFPSIMEHYFKRDPNLKDEIVDEREKLSKLFKLLNEKNNIKYHIHGHFHKYEVTDNLYTQHISLSKNEFYEIK